MNLGLELCNLQCCRGERLLFDRLDAQTLPGQILKVSGPNGAGKTSLLRMICGLLAPTNGKILWQGKTLSSIREEFGRQLVYIGHASATKDDLTTFENLRISAVLAGTRVSAVRGKAALTAVGLGRHIATPAGLLSQGQGGITVLTSHHDVPIDPTIQQIQVAL